MRVISRTLMVLSGIVVLALGIIVEIGVFTAIMSGSLQRLPNTFAAVGSGMGLMYSVLFLGAGAITGGLLFLMPVKMGRRFRAASYTTPDADVVPKAYRTGGITLLIFGGIAIVTNFLLAPMSVLDLVLLLVVIAAGVIGVTAGSGKVK